MTGDNLSALIREYPPETGLFEENDPGSRMYVICTRSESAFVRLRLGTTRIDLAAQAGILASQGPAALRQLKLAGCLPVDGEDLLVASERTLDEYATFVDLEPKYDTPEAQLPAEAIALPSDERINAMRRLLSALHLSPDELAQRQAALASRYQRYSELKQRFSQIEGVDE